MHAVRFVEFVTFKDMLSQMNDSETSQKHHVGPHMHGSMVGPEPLPFFLEPHGSIQAACPIPPTGSWKKLGGFVHIFSTYPRVISPSCFSCFYLRGFMMCYRRYCGVL